MMLGYFTNSLRSTEYINATFLGRTNIVSGGEVTNIAKGRPAFQSSIYGNGIPLKAANGNTR